MSKVFMNKRKTVTAVIAVVMCALIIFGGTFAWQSIQQEAINEVKAVVNPGGRLHDDFNDITEELNADTMTFDKNVFAENFTTYASNGVQIYARIRLDEYMELGTGAGDLNAANRDVKSVVHGATLDNKTSWTPHIPNNTNDPFHEYWNWDVSDVEDANKGQVIYMPTFNKNKDSLEADINGTFEAGFEDYIDYSAEVNKTDSNKAIYDADNDDGTDELVRDGYSADAVIDGTQTLPEQYNQHVTLEDETHTAKETLNAYVITMEDWLKLPAEQQKGDFWVWDSDGWAYWANAISPETATGTLLEGISRTKTVINDDWYYAINVVGQFITKDNLGKEDGTGFYATNAGKTPSSNALKLLNAIGVEVDTTVAEGDVDALENALELGGNINLTGEYNVDANNTTALSNKPVEYFWTTGGILTGGTLTTDNGGTYAGLFINAESGYPETNDGAMDAIVNDLTVTGRTGYSVYAQALDADITLNSVAVDNSWGGGIYADFGSGKVSVNNCTVNVPTASTGDDAAVAYQRSAIAAAHDANVVVNGGTYTGEYAAYVYNTGGTITILDGTFNGKLAEDAGELIIKGGSFSVDPSKYVDLDTYMVEHDTATDMYTVK